MLANLFLHYAFDMWMARTFPAIPFERYVDDVVVHCVSEKQARYVLAEIGKRMTRVGLALHPEKTRIVYCQDGNRRGSYEHTEFVFLGYGFQRRSASSKDGMMFVSFLPAISKQQASPEEDQYRGAVLATAPSHTLNRSGPRRLDQPDRAGLDELLRGVLPIGPVSPPGTHQRLPAAVGPSKVQTAAGQEESPFGMEQSRPETPEGLRPLGVGHPRSHGLVTRATRAV